MSFSTRAACCAGLVFAFLAAAPVRAAYSGGFLPEFPEVFAPAGSYGEPLRVRTAWRTPGVQVRIEVSCGHFYSTGTPTIDVTSDFDGWLSTGYYMAPAAPQACAMTFTEAGGSAATLAVPVNVYDGAGVVMTVEAYDPATVVLTPEESVLGVTTEAARSFTLKLMFHTASGQAITNNVAMAMSPTDPVMGASAEVDFVGYTDIAGARYVNGLCNNAVGDWELVIDLQHGARWRIPVFQGTPPPGWRRHWGRM